VYRYLKLLMAIAILAFPMPAADVAVVVDVSGTMGRYGPWQSDALALTQAVLSGESFDKSRFVSTGSPQAVFEFKLNPGEAIHVLRFGSIQTSGFPFFNPPDKTTVAQLPLVFPRQAKDFAQTRTNKELAIAVAGRLIGSPARMIVISDFLVDADANQQQQQFINDFQAQNGVQTPLIFNWLTDKRVMIRMMVASTSPLVTPLPSPQSNEAPSVSPQHQVQILEARQAEGSPSQVQIRWRLVPTGTAKSYRISVRDARTRKIVRDQAGLVLPSATVQLQGPGDYLVMVTAEFENGSQAVSRSFPVKVEGSGNLILVLLGLVAVRFAAWLVVHRINQKKAASRRAEMNEDS
jgi:hypothetical protein